MNFLLKSKNKKDLDYKKIFGIVVFVVLLGTGVLFPNFSSKLSKNILTPFFFVKDKSYNIVYYITDFFSFKSSLIKENNRLLDEVNKLRLTKIDYELLLKENDELKSEFGRQVERNRIQANIISKPPQSPYDSFVIDVGTKQGVRLNSMVYVSDGMVLGRIVEVNDKFSLVRLFSTSGEKTEVTNSRTGANYVIEGAGGADFKITLPKDADVIWGDNLVLPSANNSLVSTVNYVDTNSQSSFKDIFARLPTNVFNVKYVYVEK